jgi:DNA-binding LytR/AlgR family response regulator
MIRCIIVDDEPLALQVLERHLNKIDSLFLAGKCLNALEAFDIIHRESIDLIFLDIKMPVLSGIDFIRSLKNPPAVIFTTAYPQYAVTSYELEAVDYLLKPVTFERFSAAIAKFLKHRPGPEPEKPYTYFKVNGKMIRIDHEDISYVQSVKDYIIIHTSEERYITHMTMKYLEELLPLTTFRRIHRSYLVNILHITAIAKNNVEMGNIKIPVGEKYKAAIRQILKIVNKED